jgi:hypothetical protein
MLKKAQKMSKSIKIFQKHANFFLKASFLLRFLRVFSKNKANPGLGPEIMNHSAKQSQLAERHTQTISLEVVVEIFGFTVVAVVGFGVGGFGVDPDSFDPLGLFRVAVDSDQDAI